MEISEEELNMIIERQVKRQVYEALNKRTTPKISTGWLQLRKQIDSYCHDHMSSNWRRKTSYSSVQQMFYIPMKKILDLHRIDEMSEDQVPIAQEIFKFLSAEFEKVDQQKEKELKTTANS
ncbi:hypothetical protein [Limosilactobacillus reuteri]|uniref:hypothetical protein n=1 Tax=Limosilactobacillus reuteri TaxID=1598 RepID=UPI002B061C89|nr:hypothetical protein [Limosilactobacillus reuteri]